MKLKGTTTFLQPNIIFGEGSPDGILDIEIPAETQEWLKGFPIGFKAEVGVLPGTRVRYAHERDVKLDFWPALNANHLGVVKDSFLYTLEADWNHGKPYMIAVVVFDGEGAAIEIPLSLLDPFF